MLEKVTFIICILCGAWLCNLISSVNSRPIVCGKPNENKVQFMDGDAKRIIVDLKNLTEYRNIYSEAKPNSSDDIEKLDELVTNFSKSVDSQRENMSKLKEKLNVEQRNANQSIQLQKEQVEEYKRRVNIVENEWRNRTLNTMQLISDWANLGAKAKMLASSQNQRRMSRTDLEEELQKSERDLTQMQTEVNRQQDLSEDAEQDVAVQQEIITTSLTNQATLEEELRKLKKDLEELLPKKEEVASSVEDDVINLCRRHGLHRK